MARIPFYAYSSYKNSNFGWKQMYTEVMASKYVLIRKTSNFIRISPVQLTLKPDMICICPLWC